MRLRVRRLLGVSALYLLFGLGMSACSGQQQEEEDLEATEQGEDETAGNEEAGDGEQSADDEVANEDAADSEATNQEASDNEEASDNTAEANAANGTENDLQEIIQEMNGQPAEMAETAPEQPLQPVADTSAPTDMPAPAPATAAATAPAQASSPLPFQPGGTPAGLGLPELGSKMAYVVEQGDTLGKIAQKIYGSKARWKEMADLSGITNPSRIYPGDLIYYTLDEVAVPFAAAYESIQKNEEQVQQGDTLATIAQRVYGTSSAWRSIWRQNDNIENPDMVPPGTSIQYIPKGAASAAVKMSSNLTKLATVKKIKTQSSLITTSHTADQQPASSTFVSSLAAASQTVVTTSNIHVMI